MDACDHEQPGGVGIVRLTSWATGAAVAITIATLACQTPSASQRIGTVIASLTGESGQPVARRADLESDRRSVNEALRLLASDRDRLLTRISSLERNLDDITGSIKSQMTARVMPENTGLQNRTSNDQLPAIIGEAPATRPADTPDWLANLPEPWPHPSSAMDIVRGPGAFPAASPPVRVAALSADTQPTVVSRTEFGVDIGSASDLAELRVLWNAAKAQHGRLIGNLRPIAVRREDRAGNTDYRLVLGPLANASAAAKLCASLGAADIMCSTRSYQGEKLTP